MQVKKIAVLAAALFYAHAAKLITAMSYRKQL